MGSNQEISDNLALSELIPMETYPKDYVRYAQAHWQALRAYRPSRLPGRIMLFRARKQPLLSSDPTLGWGNLTRDVSVHVIPGTHEKMLEEPNVQILVRRAQGVPGGSAERGAEG